MTEFAAHVEDFCTRLFEDIRKLTADTCGVTREGYTPEEDKVHERLAEAAREIGLEVHADAALNLWMTLPGRNRDLPAFVSGSHTDSVPQGGNYDGLAGIVAPLAVAKYLKDANRIPERDFCIVAFRMEECPEFGRAYAGSLALTGQLNPFELELPHRDTGKLLKDVLLERGVDVERIASGESLIDLSKIAAFVELHIEQGPRLDKEPVNRAAVVTGIRGYLRHKRCRVEGETAHSGAVDYEFRHDAVAALTDLLYVMNRHWEAWLHDGKDLVFTCGVINTPSTADISIISGDVSFGLDMRSLSMETIRAFHDLLLEEAAAIDGCGPLRTYFSVVLPMLRPTMISVGILEIMWVWNDYLLPYLVLDRTKYMTIPIHIQYLKGSYGTVDLGATMALILLSIIPVIVFYLLCQKYIIKGVAAGAVKG